MNHEDYWGSFVERESKFYDIDNRKYLKKGYLHFDQRIWFPEYLNKFRKFILSPSLIVSHSFYPFLKVNLITKRIRHDKTKGRRTVQPKERPICYAAHFDALIYSFYTTVLSEKYEVLIQQNGLENNVLAYRPLEKCNIDFAEEVFKYIENKGECVAIALDIKGFFDTLNHDILKEKWLEVINTNEPNQYKILPKDHFAVYRSLTNFSFIEKEDVLRSLSLNEKKLTSLRLKRFCEINEFRNKVKPFIKKNPTIGIPQGSPISATLSNIYMIDYDKAIFNLSKKMNFLYRRYCDDIIVICDTANYLGVKKSLYEEIGKMQLTIQPEKEDVVFFYKAPMKDLRGYSDSSSSIYKNLQYLGFEFNGQNRYIRSSSVSRFYRRMKVGVRETIKRAYGNNSKGGKLYKKKLHDRFTHLGSRNFLTYAYRAADIMHSPTIKKQLSKHTDKLNETIEEKTNKHLWLMRSKGKRVIKKK